MLEISTKIGALAPTDELLTAIAEEAARLLDVDNAGFRLVEGDDLVLAGLTGTAAQTMLRSRLRVGESLGGRVVAEGRTLVAALDDVRDCMPPEHFAAGRALGYTTYLGVPLRVAGRVTGVLSFRARRPFTDADVELAEAFAAQAAVALEHARLYRSVSQQAARMAALADVGRLVSATLRVDAAADKIVQSLLTLFGGQVAVVYQVERDGSLRTIAVAGDGGPLFAAGGVLPPGTGVAGASVRERRVVVSADILSDARLTYPDEIRAHVEQAAQRVVLAAPMIAHDRVVGAIVVGDRPGRVFDGADVRLVEAFAAQAAAALDNARLYEQTERARQGAETRVRRLTTLSAVTRTMTSTRDRRQVFEAVARAAVELLGAYRAQVWLPDPAARVMRAQGGSGGDIGGAHSAAIPFGHGVLASVYESGVPEYIADVQQDARWYNQRLARDAGLHTYFGLPLVGADGVIGVLSILWREQRPWTAEDQELAALLANQAVAAIDNAALYEAVDVRAKRFTTLARLDQLVSSSLDTAEVLSGIARAAAELMRAPLVHCWVADQDAGVLTIGGASDPHPEEGLVARLPIGEGAAGWIAAHRERLDIPDVLADGRFASASWARARGVRRFHGVPITIEGELLGVLALLGGDDFHLGPEDVELIETFAAQAAVAIRNARLYREAREHAREAREYGREAREYAERVGALEEVNRLVSSSLHTDEILRNLARAAGQFFDAVFVSVWSFDPASARLRRAAFHGDRRVAEALRGELAAGDGLVGWCVLHRSPIVWSDAMRDPRVLDVANLEAHGLRYVTAYPIVIGDRVLGAIVVYRETPSRVPAETASLLGSLAAQAGVAIDHARLYETATRRLAETRALLDVAEILSSTLESRELLERVAIKIAEVCGVDRCSVQLWDGDRVIPVTSQFADGHRRPDLWQAFRGMTPRPPRDVPAHARAIETRRPVVIDDTSIGDELPREWIDVFALRSCMVVPLVRHDRVIGVMTLDHSERPTPFDAGQADFAMAIGGQLALAIENTRLYEELRQRLHETSTLLSVSRVLDESGSPVEMMRRVAREVARAFGADSTGAYLVDEQKEQLVGIAGYHVPPALLERFATHPIRLDEFPAIAAAWREGRAVWSENPQTDPRFRGRWLAGLPDHSVMFAAATVRGEPVGALFLVWWRPGRAFSAAEIALVEAVARQVGLAMDNAALARQREQKLRETERLLSMSRALGSTLDLTGLLRRLLREVARTVDVDSVGLWTVGDGGDWMEAVSGYRVPPERREALRALRLSVVSDAFYAEAARTRRAVVSRDVMSDPRVPDAVKRIAPHRTQLFVPIVVNERFIGGVIAVWWTRVGELSDGELALIEAMASQAGVAIEHARLFQENRRQVQELSVLHELSRAVTGELDRTALLEAVHAQVSRVLDGRDMTVVLRDEAGDGLEVALLARKGVRDGSVPWPHPAPRTGLLPVVMATGRAIRTADYLDECRRRGVEPVATAAPHAHWLGVPLRVGDGTIGAVVLRSADRPFSDADERLMANIADLAALALRSAVLFAQRTRAYRELATAQDELVRTEKLRALGEMASGVAHDFNNLLAAILGRAQLLLGRIEDPKLRRWLQVIERAALDGAQTVRRLQEFTRIRRDERLEPVDLNAIVRDALEMTRSRWREEPRSRGVTIDVTTELGDVPVATGDAVELREALMNLILNAVDAMPGGGTLSVATQPAGGGVELRVSDTGIGMPEAVKSRIFDPFFTTKGPRGTGLGLSITYGILSRHGVVIGVDSHEGRGTTFRLLFPRGDDISPAAPAAPAPDTAAGTSLVCLVVDDDEAVGAVVADMIAARGHRSVLVLDPADAVRRLSTERFDVVFTDLAMPRLSGWDVARAVKDGHPDVPVFVVTGFGVELTDEQRREHGVDGILVKPLGLGDVVATLERVQRHRPH